MGGGDVRPLPPASTGPGGEPARPPLSAWLGRLWRLEDGLGLVLLLAMTALPIVEIGMYRLGSSIPGATRIVQTLTLWVGLVGAVLAARENRHLALASGSALERSRAGRVVALLVTALAAAVTLVLARGAFATVWAGRTSTEDVALGVPAWIPQLALPIGYLALAVRLASVRAPTMAVAGMLLALSSAAVWALGSVESDVARRLSVPLLIGVIASAPLGAPIYVVLGGAALVLFWGDDVPVAAVAAETLRQLEDETLPVLPLFTFTGYVLAASRASERLVAAFRGLFGWLPGGMAVMTAVVCAFFTTFTGASGVTILALGGLLYPVLSRENYPTRFTIGLLTASGSIGLLFPPALPVIIYGVVAGVPIDRLFVAGLLPGFVLVGAVALLGIRTALITPSIVRHPFQWAATREALWEAKWELLVPIVATGAYFTGLASLLESAAMTSLYVLVVAVFIHREVDARRLLEVGRDSAALVGGVLVIFGVAMGLTNYLNDAMIPSALLEWVQGTVESRWVFLIVLNLFLLVVGCFMDIFSALVVVVPLILPLGVHFGIDPIHLGIIFLANLELGFLTPPVGMNLFLASFRFERPVVEVYRMVGPFLVVLLLAVLLITYVPALTLGPVELFYPPDPMAPPPIDL